MLREHNIVGWNDLFARGSTTLARIAERIAYREPLMNDSNRSRWPLHPFWRVVQEQIAAATSETASCVNEAALRRTWKAEKRRQLQTQTAGLIRAQAALDGVDADGFEAYAHGATVRVVEEALQDPFNLQEKLDHARARYADLKD